MVLPDYLAPGLRVVFCGTAAGLRSASRGHYYSGTGNDFWRFLHESGITLKRFQPEDDSTVCVSGIGLTDLAKTISASSDAGLKKHYKVAEFIGKIERYAPRWVAFHGKEPARHVAKHLKHRGGIVLGMQTWKLGTSSVFVLPSASGANRDASRLQGKGSRLEWFRELAQLL